MFLTACVIVVRARSGIQHEGDSFTMTRKARWGFHKAIWGFLERTFFLPQWTLQVVASCFEIGAFAL